MFSQQAWQEKQEREKRIEQRFKIIQLLGKEWQYFRLLQEAAVHRPDKPVAVDSDLEQRYYLEASAILNRLREMEQLGLVEVLEDATGKIHAYQITRTDEVGQHFIDMLFR